MFFDSTDNTGIDGDIIFEDLFHQHVNTLVVYKRLAEAKDIHGDVLECTAEVLESLVKKYFPTAFGLFGASQHGFEWLGTRYMVCSSHGLMPICPGPATGSSKYRHFVDCAPLQRIHQARTSSPSGQLASTRHL